MRDTLKATQKTYPKNNKLSTKTPKNDIEFVNFGKKIYILTMSDSKMQNKINDIWEKFLKCQP